jgi:hypothetical protein
LVLEIKFPLFFRVGWWTYSCCLCLDLRSSLRAIDLERTPIIKAILRNNGNAMQMCHFECNTTWPKNIFFVYIYSYISMFYNFAVYLFAQCNLIILIN